MIPGWPTWVTWERPESGTGHLRRRLVDDVFRHDGVTFRYEPSLGEWVTE